MKGFTIFVLVVVLHSAYSSVHSNKYSEFEKIEVCRYDRSDDLSLCVAGSFKSVCNTMKCLRLPGQQCRKGQRAELYGEKCHRSSECGCDGFCDGSLFVNGENHSHSPSCIDIHSKRNQPELDYIENDNENNLLDYPVVETFK